ARSTFLLTNHGREHQELGLPAGRADLSHAALQSHPPPIRTLGEPLRFTCLKDFRESLLRGKRVRAAMTVWTGLPPPRGDWCFATRHFRTTKRVFALLRPNAASCALVELRPSVYLHLG